MGYAADIVENGREAVERLTQSTEPDYDLILMDWQMPEMDGITATKLIREFESADGPHIPIIGMTANVMKGARESCLAAGMDDYLSKPIDTSQLNTLLAHWLSERNDK